MERHSMLAGVDTIVVAVSGGPDSTALLDVMRRLGVDIDILVAHVDHGLGPASQDVAADVAKRAAAAGFDVHLARATGLEGPNLQARARAFRFSFFESLAEKEGADLIVTGHTLDDRIETSLARFIHGASTDTLAGLSPMSPGSGRIPRARPLIEVRRREVRDYCEERGLGFYEDPANSDPRFERSEVRALLARIEDRWGDGGVRAMATSIDRIAEDATALATQAERLFEGLVRRSGTQQILDLATMLKLPKALRRRVLESAVGPLQDRGPGIAEVLNALDGPLRSGMHFDISGGWAVDVDEEKLIVSRPPDKNEEGESGGLHE